MNIVYTGEPLPTRFAKSVFLCGPTPRSADVLSWRPAAIEHLKQQGYDGTVFVPEFRQYEAWDKLKENPNGYENQIQWETDALNMSDTLLFWVPRDMQTLPGLTTNIEFGAHMTSGKVVFGAPPESQHTGYLRNWCDRLKIPQATTLQDTVRLAVDRTREGALREGGECMVPLQIWKSSSFQSWITAQKKVGNRLDSARVFCTFRPGLKDFIFVWGMHVDIYVAAEKRNKSNEIVVSRPDISSVIMYYQHHEEQSIYETSICLVREFRSPVSNETGFVWEPPSGSSKVHQDPKTVAVHEVEEETGLRVDVNRIKVHSSRQLAATFSTHKGVVCSYRLNVDEFEQLKQQVGKLHGLVGDSEQTYVELMSLRDILKNSNCDWTTLGMVFETLWS